MRLEPARRAIFLLLMLVGAMFASDGASAQTAPLKRVAGLSGFGCDRSSPLAQIFLRRMEQLGWVEGQNYVNDCVSTLSLEQLPSLAAELISRQPDVLLTSPIAYVRTLKQATTGIPIVMISTADPVENGLVTNLPRPEANVTGVASSTPELISKRIELLKEILPGLSRVAIIYSGAATMPFRTLVRENLTAAASRFGFTWQDFDAKVPEDVDVVLAHLGAERFDAVYIPPGAMFFGRQKEIVALALRHRLAPVSDLPVFAKNGFLFTYGADSAALWVRGAEYVDKILRGAKPGDLPVELPTRFSLAINLQTAQALGITVPPAVLVRADEVIE